VCTRLTVSWPPHHKGDDFGSPSGPFESACPSPSFFFASSVLIPVCFLHLSLDVFQPCGVTRVPEDAPFRPFSCSPIRHLLAEMMGENCAFLTGSTRPRSWPSLCDAATVSQGPHNSSAGGSQISPLLLAEPPSAFRQTATGAAPVSLPPLAIPGVEGRRPSMSRMGALPIGNIQ
jgi:hypothetical protein